MFKITNDMLNETISDIFLSWTESHFNLTQQDDF